MLKYYITSATILLFTMTLVTLSVWSSGSQANDTANLQAYLAQEIGNANQAVRSLDTNAPSPYEQEQFFFRRFWLRLQARVGFSLPGMLNISVVPEFEMLWERSVPDGWTAYKPTEN